MLLAVIVLLVLLMGGAFTASRYWFPSIPNPEEVASEPIEIRRYHLFDIPRDGSSLGARWDQAKWSIAHPGRARVMDLAKRSSAPDGGLKDRLVELGYAFPPGTYVLFGDVVPELRIAHHPSVLSHIERYVDLDRQAP